jgi:hypothetical protein
MKITHIYGIVVMTFASLSASNVNALTPLLDSETAPQPRPICTPFCPPNDVGPVCGTDGKTYGTNCLLNIASCESINAGNSGISVKYQGPCRRQCPAVRCMMIYSPICGSDGITYSNRCVFDSAKCKNPTLTIQYNGNCKTLPKCQRPCGKILRPVCGNDGITYANDCIFGIAQCKNASLSIVSQGQCELFI